MNLEFKGCAQEYLEKVNAACLLIIEGMKFPIPSDPTSWISFFPSQRGTFNLNGHNKFFLHGFGCDFHCQSFSVRWDFGMNGEWKGIAPWMFTDYIRDNKKLSPEFYEWQRVIDELRAAVLAGEMEKRGDHYFFLEQKRTVDLSHLNI